LRWMGANCEYHKTAIMIFNKGGRQLKESFDFSIWSKDYPNSKNVLLPRNNILSIGQFQNCAEPPTTESSESILRT
jgi:hypothetical protein